MADTIETESAAALLEFKNGGKMLEGISIKQEIDDDEEEEIEAEDEQMQLGPAALGLQRVGTPAPPKTINNSPMPVLNARGMPARIRKKNRLFFDDDIVNTPHHRVPSAKKQKTTPLKKPKILTPSKPIKDSPRMSKKYMTPMKELKTSRPNTPPPLQSPDRKIGQKIGMRLRNLLKLPKAHKWVCYEWFYSNIDKTLFEGDNDFTICLKESFPELKTRELARIEWTKIRRMMGKPRRCSQAFFNQERLDLEKKRNKIRALQQRKATDMANFQDLPPEIPMQLVIGTKVTARLRKPQDGLFTGSIDAVDTSNNTYRITFERQGLGTHSVPDYEVLSNEAPETMTLSTLYNKTRTRTLNYYSAAIKSPPFHNKLKKDPLLSGSVPYKPIVPGIERMNNCPVKLLEKMVLVTKILNTKKQKVKALKSMNTEAERLKSFDNEFPEDFARRYASNLVDLEKLNQDLQKYLEEMQTQCQEFAPEPSVAAMLAPSHLRERCKEEAKEIVTRHNNMGEKPPVTNQNILDLVTSLTALMLQIKSLSDSDQNAYELQVLQGTMEQIKRGLSPSHQVIFQNSIEVPMKHFQIALGHAHTSRVALSGGRQ